MTVVQMSEKGQIVVPKDIRDRHGYANGSAFLVLENNSGAIQLRPVNTKPKLTLLEHFRRLQGLEIPELRVHCPPRV